MEKAEKKAPRRKGKATRFPGIKMLGGGRASIRIYYVNPKNKLREEAFFIRDGIQNAQQANELKERLRKEILAKLESTPGEMPRLSTYVESWLLDKQKVSADGKKKPLSPSTLDRYTRTLAHFVLDKPIGKMFLDKITKADVEEWRDDQNDDSAVTINTRLRLLKTLLADGAADYVIAAGSPAARVQFLAEKKKYTRENPNALTASERRALLDGAKAVQPKWHILILVLATTGMRIGEATALRWDDVLWPDPENGEPGRILVQHGQYRGVLKDPKTEGSVRDCYVGPEHELWTALRHHRRFLGTWTLHANQRDAILAKKTPHEVKALQEHYRELGWVFPNSKEGKDAPIFTSVLRKPLKQILDYLEGLGEGVTSINVHGLRRTVNTLMDGVVSPAQQRQQMGHTQPATNLLYVAQVDEKRVEASRALDEYIRIQEQKTLPKKAGQTPGRAPGRATLSRESAQAHAPSARKRIVSMQTEEEVA